MTGKDHHLRREHEPDEYLDDQACLRAMRSYESLPAALGNTIVVVLRRSSRTDFCRGEGFLVCYGAMVIELVLGDTLATACRVGRERRRWARRNVNIANGSVLSSLVRTLPLHTVAGIFGSHGNHSLV
jgi:hypothetical protein